MDKKKIIEDTSKLLDQLREEKKLTSPPSVNLRLDDKAFKVLIKEVRSGNYDSIQLLKKLLKGINNINLEFPESFKIDNWPEFPKPVKEVTVANFPKPTEYPEFPEEIKVANFPKPTEYPEFPIKRFVSELKQVGIEVDLDRYRDANKPLAVRLSDGKNFYKAIARAISTAVDPNPLVSTPFNGQATIAVTSTAVQLGSNALTNGVIVTALSTNSAAITVGGSGVTNTVDGTGNGYILEAGASASWAVANTNDLYINGTAGDIVSFAGS